MLTPVFNVLVDIGACASNPCMNNGTCVYPNAGPCVYNGTCDEGLQNFTCTCDAGFVGATCDVGTITLFFIH